MRTHNLVKYSRYLSSSPKFMGISIYDLMIVSFAAFVISLNIKGLEQALQNIILFSVSGTIYGVLFFKNRYLPDGYFMILSRGLTKNKTETMNCPIIKEGEENV